MCFLRFFLVVPATCILAFASEDAKPLNQQPDALTRAAEEFKVLTRDWGMRPESPPTSRTHYGSKLLWHGEHGNARPDHNVSWSPTLNPEAAKFYASASEAEQQVTAILQ